MLALDIGHTYLAYALWNFEAETLSYGFSPKFTNSAVPMSEKISEWLDTLDFETAVIERQVWQNKKAVTVQNVLVGVLAGLKKGVRLVYATEKFKSLGLECITQGKQHKKLSVTLALDWIGLVEDISEQKLGDFQKKDDIADAVNMLRTNLN
jgi:hypothetical protein